MDIIHNTHDYRKRECGNIRTTGRTKSRSYEGLNMTDESSGLVSYQILRTILVYQLLFPTISELVYQLLFRLTCYYLLFNPWRPLQLTLQLISQFLSFAKQKPPSNLDSLDYLFTVLVVTAKEYTLHDVYVPGTI
jgi:hypothetical protein